MIELTEQPIDFQNLTEAVRDNAAGAVVLFLGTVREFTSGVQTAWLAYEAYPEMARASMAQLETEVRAQFTVTKVAISHRFGKLELGDVSVAIAVSSPHRAQAFDAGRWLIDTLKERVPIWKKEHYSDGREAWQHPGLPIASVSRESASRESVSRESVNGGMEQ